jgi:methyl-accepting chemotaxis protein
MKEKNNIQRNPDRKNKIMGRFIFLSLLVIFSLIAFCQFQNVPYLLPISSFLGFFITLLGLYISLKKRPLGALGEERSWTDPILLLSGYGLDLYDLVDEIGQITDEVNKRLVSIKEQADLLDEKIRQTNEDMGNIFQIVTQLANQEVTLIDDVGKTSDEITFMFEIVNSVIEEIDSRNENMQNLVKMSRTGGEKVIKTNLLIKNISDKAGDMMKMVDFINKITKETNLLAINAAIEASHSDNEGKGFAVIADEMKKLAVLTSQKAKEISKLMQTNVEDYNEAHIASQSSGEAFQFISSEIHLVSGTIAEVVQTIGELKQRGGDVLKKAQILDQSALAVKDSSGEVYGEIVNVNDTLNTITELSDSVKTSVKEIAELEKTITQKTEKVHQLSKQINTETDRFLGVFEKSPNNKM